MKQEPNDKDAEMAVIGAILLEKQAFAVARTFVKADAFYHEPNRLVFLACERLFSENVPIEAISVTKSLRSEKMGNSCAFDRVGMPMIGEMMSSVSSAENLEFHCRIIMEMWMRRCLSKVSLINANRAFDYTYDVFDVLYKSQGELSKITEMLSTKKNESVGEIAYKVLSSLENEDDSTYFLPTGIPEMDKRVKICGGDLVIVAARPGMGKTSLITTIMLNLGLMGKRGVFFSMEMPKEQIVQKLLAAHSDVPYWKIRERKCSLEERERLFESYSQIKGMTTMINDTSNLTIEEIKAHSIAENSKEPISYIIADFLQITRPSGGNGTRDQEIGHITRNAKGLAKELNVPVIYLSQLSRAVEQRGGEKRPQLSDLRESGNIEQDSDTVIFMYRPEYYGIEVDESNNSTKGKCEIDYAKNRHGGTGSVVIDCRMDTGKFW